MLLSTNVIAFADGNYYIDENYIYHRGSNVGQEDEEWREFYVDSDSKTAVERAADFVREQMVNRVGTISFGVALTDKRFAYTDEQGNSIALQNCDYIVDAVLTKVFTQKGNSNIPYAYTDYLYHSINWSAWGDVGRLDYTTFVEDTIKGGEHEGEHIYAYSFKLVNVPYYTTVEQENYIYDFVQKFTDEYIDNNPEYIVADSNTKYRTLKTIYDFIVRNVEYDQDVFDRKYTFKNDKDRYNRAHSAYGAICGKVEKDGKFSELDLTDIFVEKEDADEYSMFADFAVTGEKIEHNYNIGRAVCEGYSKLLYALCIYNGIECRIVDGDHKDVVNGVEDAINDPHEWNCVYLDDHTGKGYSWYQLDSTFGSAFSIKSIDYNAYDFFLVGTKTMDKANHQIPYKSAFDEYGNINFMHSEVLYERPLIDWEEEARLDEQDYQYPIEYDFFAIKNEDYSYDKVKKNVLVSRKYQYNYKDEKGNDKTDIRTAFIVCSKDENGDFNNIRIEIDENMNVVESNDLGFPYRSVEDTVYTYDFHIPYIVDADHNLEVNVSSEGSITNVFGDEISDFILTDESDKDKRKMLDCGDYYVEINEDSETRDAFVVKIPIIPLNMNGDADEQYSENYSDISITAHAYYTGEPFFPTASVIDGYGKLLINERDYDIKMYTDSSYSQIATDIEDIRNIGEYYLGLKYKGNYSGLFKFKFIVDKINFDFFKISESDILPNTYVPKRMRSVYPSIESAVGPSKKIGDITLINGKDFYVTSTNETGNASTLDYGSKGDLILVGKAGSEYIIPDTKAKIPYAITEKYDINQFNVTGSSEGLNNQPICILQPEYTGSPVLPAFDNLARFLEADEYIVSQITDNVNAGRVYVTVNGAGGCTGTVKMFYDIQPASIGNTLFNYSFVGGTLFVQLTFNGRTLVEGVDYDLIKSANNLSFVGKGNFCETLSVGIDGVGAVPVATNPTELPMQTVNPNQPADTPSASTGNPATGSQQSSGTSSQSPSQNAQQSAQPQQSTSAPQPSVTTPVVVQKVTVKKAAIKKLTAGKKQFKATWSKVSGVNGYEVQYATDKNFKKNKKTVKITKQKTTSLTVKKLKSKTKYYVRIRSYKIVNGQKYYSAWSSSKNIKVK